jgi:hypothetical protein
MPNAMGSETSTASATTAKAVGTSRRGVLAARRTAVGVMG